MCGCEEVAGYLELFSMALLLAWHKSQLQTHLSRWIPLTLALREPCRISDEMFVPCGALVTPFSWMRKWWHNFVPSFSCLMSMCGHLDFICSNSSTPSFIHSHVGAHTHIYLYRCCCCCGVCVYVCMYNIISS